MVERNAYDERFESINVVLFLFFFFYDIKITVIRYNNILGTRIRMAKKKKHCDKTLNAFENIQGTFGENWAFRVIFIFSL